MAEDFPARPEKAEASMQHFGDFSRGSKRFFMRLSALQIYKEGPHHVPPFPLKKKPCARWASGPVCAYLVPSKFLRRMCLVFRQVEVMSSRHRKASKRHRLRPRFAKSACAINNNNNKALIASAEHSIDYTCIEYITVWDMQSANASSFLNQLR